MRVSSTPLWNHRYLDGIQHIERPTSGAVKTFMVQRNFCALRNRSDSVLTTARTNISEPATFCSNSLLLTSRTWLGSIDRAVAMRSSPSITPISPKISFTGRIKSGSLLSFVGMKMPTLPCVIRYSPLARSPFWKITSDFFKSSFLKFHLCFCTIRCRWSHLIRGWRQTLSTAFLVCWPNWNCKRSLSKNTTSCLLVDNGQW